MNDYMNKVLNLYFLSKEYEKDEYGENGSNNSVCPSCKVKGVEALIDLQTNKFKCTGCKITLTALEYIDKMYEHCDDGTYHFWEGFMDSMG